MYPRSTLLFNITYTFARCDSLRYRHRLARARNSPAMRPGYCQPPPFALPVSWLAMARVQVTPLPHFESFRWRGLLLLLLSHCCCCTAARRTAAVALVALLLPHCCCPCVLAPHDRARVIIVHPTSAAICAFGSRLGLLSFTPPRRPKLGVLAAARCTPARGPPH